VTGLSLVHLYPREMNIYGDTGNVLVLRRRLANPPSVELRIAAAEQMEITKTRLLGALGAVPAPDPGRHPLRLRVAAPRGALAS